MSTAQERLARMFDMGAYGEKLAAEILAQHVRELAETEGVELEDDKA